VNLAPVLVNTAPADRLTTLPPWDFDAGIRTVGFAAAHWAEQLLIQPNGPRAGKPFVFTGDQLTFLAWWYAVDEQGQWLFSKGVRRLAKGSGKSPFAAVLALIEFCGPCRLDRFDDRIVGGCRAKPVDMPLVQIAATAESQTANTMRMVRAFAPKGSKIVERYNLDPGKTIYYKAPEGILQVITSSWTAAEGAEASFAVGDETEHWKPSNGGVELESTLADNLAKSGSRMVETSNAWAPGVGSVAENTWDAWVAQEEGRTVETAVLYDARMAPPETDVRDHDSLTAGLEFVYGDCDWKKPDPASPPDVRPIIKRIRTLTAKEDDSKRKYLNWPTAAEDAWQTPEAWKRLAEPREVDAEEPVVLFFDGSKSRDATGFVACAVEDGYVFVPRWPNGDTVWEPNPSHDTEDVVPADEVDAAEEWLFDNLNVVGFFGDVKEWESFVKITWPQRHKDRLKVMAVPSGKDPQPIAWDMRSHTFDFTQAVELCDAEITDGQFHHDGNPVLLRHVGNARRKGNRYGISIGKESPSSPKKIDLAVCMVGARMVRRLLLGSKEWQKYQRRVTGKGRVIVMS
jgi:hypothetical protein